MLILPPGHAQAMRKPRALRTREKWMLRGLAGALVALVVAVVISFATVGHTSGHGCISVGLAYSTGGAQIYRCGASARAMCASVNRPDGLIGGAARSMSIECRKARLPIG